MDNIQREIERYNTLTRNIIGAGIEVHRALGPGLLESVYEDCLCHEFGLRGIEFQRQVFVPIAYKELRIDHGLKLDILVEDSVIIELKAVEQLTPIHEVQLMTYLKLTGCKVGLLMNFNVTLLINGIRRRVHNFPELKDALLRQDDGAKERLLREEDQRRFEQYRDRL